MIQQNLGTMLASIIGGPPTLAERRTVSVNPDTLAQMIQLDLVDLVNDGSINFYTYCGYPLLANPFAEPIDVDPATLFAELIDGAKPCDCPPGACLGAADEVASPLPGAHFEPYTLELPGLEPGAALRYPKRELLADLARAAGSLSAAMLVIAEQVELLEGDE